jgi:sugar lactone lactonase YvrE
MLAFLIAAGCADSAADGHGSSETAASGSASSGGSTSAASADTTGTTGEPQPPSEPVVLFESPAGAFFESVVVAEDGSVYFTDMINAKVFRSIDGDVTEYATLDDHPNGLGIDTDGTIYVTTIHEAFFELPEPFVATNAIYAADGEGGATLVLDAPQAGFLNGMAPLAPGVFLVTDSSASTIWRFDVAAATLEPWLEHDLLAPVAGLDAPGANGVKIVGDTAYVSNTSHLQLLQIPIDASMAAGEPSTAIVGALIDDFAFGASGAIYAATHVADVVRVELGGMPETIASGSDGVTGSTAVAFGRSGWDADAIYVVTDGGLFAADGDASAAGPARLVLVPVGEPAG